MALEMVAGYSGAPLPKKLGLKPAMTAVFVGAPPGFVDSLGDLTDVKILKSLHGKRDYIHLFATTRRRLEEKLPASVRALEPAGALWISWPKKSSGVETDLDRERVRELGLAAGLVDVKVCAVDEVWSGLKFVWRLADRAVVKKASHGSVR